MHLFLAETKTKKPTANGWLSAESLVGRTGFDTRGLGVRSRTPMHLQCSQKCVSQTVVECYVGLRRRLYSSKRLKRRYWVLLLTLQFAFLPLHSSENAPTFYELIVANFDESSAACHARFPVGSVRCADDSCEMPTPATSSLKGVRLSFSCIPLSAPTGFENARPDATVYSVQTPNVKGHVSLIDEPLGEPGGANARAIFLSVRRVCHTVWLCQNTFSEGRGIRRREHGDYEISENDSLNERRTKVSIRPSGEHVIASISVLQKFKRSSCQADAS
jgi:hypothetical protein